MVQSKVVGKSRWKQLEVRLSTDQGRLAVRGGKTIDSEIKQLGFTPVPHDLAVQYQTRDCPSTGLDYSTHRAGKSLEGGLRGR